MTKPEPFQFITDEQIEEWSLEEYLAALNERGASLVTDHTHWHAIGVYTARDLAKYLDGCVENESREALMDDECEETYAGPWVVCLYLVDRAYGGSEEGGWYYDCGQPVLTTHLRAFDKEDEARDYRNKLNDTVAKEMNEGRPSVSSVLSEGRYEFQVCDGMPEAYPTERPRYE